ncbi:MAG: hypothetical protein ABSF03_07015 [Streptosporangiaceae bacterium]
MRFTPTRMRRALAATAALALTGGLAAAAVSPAANAATSTAAHVSAAASAARPNGDSPAGFWYGTDSLPIKISGSAPYQEPKIGGRYAGYIGMTGSWAVWLGCRGGFTAWSGTNASQANTNYTSYGVGIGLGVYWFMGGPGVDPNYNGTTTEAYAWGQRQAAQAVADANKLYIKYRVLFMDVELPGVAPAHDNGWNSVYTSACSGVTKASYIPANVDRADFNGFYDYENAHGYTPGVYSEPGIWASIFGTGTASQIPNVDEWTYEPETTNFAAAPVGWCLKGTSTCARFFGGVTTSSPHALMWQWSGGGGVSNGVGDFDQIDTKVVR